MIAAIDDDDDKRQNLPLGRRVIDKGETQMVGEEGGSWTLKSTVGMQFPIACSN